jgi:hypothetical protein
MTDPDATTGLRWSSGAWFGSQFGATAWMLVGGLLAAPRDLAAGGIALLLFAVPNAVGLALWRTRRFSCYASTQLLMATAGLCGLLCVYALDRAGLWERIQVGAQVSAAATYAVLALVFGGMMLVLHLRFGRSAGATVRG